MVRLKHWLRILLSSFLLGLLLGGLSAARRLHRLELPALDALMRLRLTLHGPQKLDPRIMLVSVDERCFEAIGKPFMFWHEEFARLLQELQRSGAVGVGFDFILNPERSGLAADDPIRQKLEKGENALAEVLLSHPVVMIEQLGPGGEAYLHSADILHFAALSRQNVGAANLLLDHDGVVRRMSLLTADDGPRALFARLAGMLGAKPPQVDNIRINFPGQAFPQISMATALERSVPEVAGKICLVTPRAASFQDIAQTPLGLLSGGEIHAAALNTVLTNSYIRPLPPWAWTLVVAALAVAVGLAAFALTARWAVVTALLLVLGYLMLALEALTQLGLWLPLAAPLLASLGAFSAGSVQRYLTVEATRRHMQALFGRFVSPQVVQNLLARPENELLGGSRQRISVLFSDINNFTPTCEKHTPEQIIAMLNRYFEAMVEISFRNGGTIKQFVGDEIMVMFGAPEPQPDHAARAVRTALEMIERLAQMAREDDGTGGFYEVKIGVHSGDVVVGNVGSLQRSEYAAVGDDVNLTARIESLAGKLGASLLVSEVTRQEAQASLPGLEWISRGPQTFKGKTVEMVVYEVRRQV